MNVTQIVGRPARGRGRRRRGDRRGPGERGPRTDLPAQVPDFVSQIHEIVGQHLDGALDGSLGDHVSGLTPEDGEVAGNQTDATTPAPTPEATATAT